ncbi:MAG: K(+)-stimulated pyrophosphate-energized sodium pump [bacterium]|jgi:K(+)-stimulated pyrophosphate-energized sodium pump
MADFIKFAPILSSIGLIVALGIFIFKKSEGNEKMQEISGLIHDGAMVYLNRQYKILTVVVIFSAIVLGIFIGYQTAIAYLLGAELSKLAGFIGMKAATRANVRTAEAARANKPNYSPAL